MVKIGTLPDWQKQLTSGLVKKHLSGLAKSTPPDMQKLGPFRIGKIGTLPDWDPSGFVKKAFQRFSKVSPDTLPDTFSDAIMLFELTRKGVFSVTRPFRIDAKPHVSQFTLTVKGLMTSLVSTQLRFSDLLSLPFLSRLA